MVWKGDATLWQISQSPPRDHHATLRAVTPILYAFSFLAVFHQYRQERKVARQYAEVATRISREQAFPFWLGAGLIRQGWASATQQQPAEQIPSMNEGIAISRATGAATVAALFSDPPDRNLGGGGPAWRRAPPPGRGPHRPGQHPGAFLRGRGASRARRVGVGAGGGPARPGRDLLPARFRHCSPPTGQV